MTITNTNTNEKIDPLLEKVDSDRRAALKRLMWATMAAPMIASFPMDGLKIEGALAAASNATTTIPKVPEEHEEDEVEKPKVHEEDEDKHDRLRRPK